MDILTSLKDAGFTVNQSLVDLYVEYSPVRNLAGPGQSGVDWSLPEPPIEKYTDALMNEAKEFSDKAIIVLSRSGGEGQDEPNDMNALIHGTYDVRDEVANGNPNYGYYDARYTNNGDYDDFDQGEHYLELSNTEEAMIEKVCAEFSDVVVVINANNTMELGWVDQYDSIGAVLLVPGTGASAMQALGSILCGDVNPSGRTVDTYVYDLFSTPTANNAGNFTFNNVSDLQAEFLAADDAFQGALAFVMDDETRELVAAKSTARYDSTRYDNPSDVMPTTGVKNGLKVIDLRGKDYDDPQWDDLLDQLTVEDMINMVNLGGFQTVAVDSIGKVGTQDSDGTSGLNDWYIQVYGTAYPTELLIAQTWNKELAYRIGQAEGQEYADCGIYGTYSPAMNTHRSAFCGRNFEYYSEDPVLAAYTIFNFRRSRQYRAGGGPKTVDTPLTRLDASSMPR